MYATYDGVPPHGGSIIKAQNCLLFSNILWTSTQQSHIFFNYYNLIKL